jgi:hypothetical protein
MESSKYKTDGPYTTLLVGGIVVGKSSVMELIADLLLGKSLMTTTSTAATSNAVPAITVKRAPPAFADLQARVA